MEGRGGYLRWSQGSCRELCHRKVGLRGRWGRSGYGGKLVRAVEGSWCGGGCEAGHEGRGGYRGGLVPGG